MVGVDKQGTVSTLGCSSSSWVQIWVTILGNAGSCCTLQMAGSVRWQACSAIDGVQACMYFRKLIRTIINWPELWSIQKLGLYANFLDRLTALLGTLVPRWGWSLGFWSFPSIVRDPGGGLGGGGHRQCSLCPEKIALLGNWGEAWEMGWGGEGGESLLFFVRM